MSSAGGRSLKRKAHANNEKITSDSVSSTGYPPDSDELIKVDGRVMKEDYELMKGNPKEKEKSREEWQRGKQSRNSLYEFKSFYFSGNERKLVTLRDA